MDRGRFDAAIPHLERALALDPNAEARGTWWVWLARATFRAGRPTDVQRVVSAALKEKLPPSLEAELLATETMRLRAVGDQELALQTARRAAQLAEISHDNRIQGLVAMTLGTTLSGRREFDEAEK